MSNVLSMEERQERNEKFVVKFVELGGNATAAARAVGVSESSAANTGNRMKERLWSDIEKEIEWAIKTYIPKALEILLELAESANSETVRFNASRDLLDRAGLKPVDRQHIEYRSPTDDMTTEEIRAELDRLFQAELQEHLRKNNLKLVYDVEVTT